MAKADKATAVADIAEQFKEASATLVTEYRGYVDGGARFAEVSVSSGVGRSAGDR